MAKDSFRPVQNTAAAQSTLSFKSFWIGSFQLVRLMKKWLMRWSVQATLRLLAFFARRPALEPVSNALTRSLAYLAVRTKAISRTSKVAELGPLWQRSFPAKKQVPIESISDHTVIAQIHTPCPLRGSGDVHACYRMMEFDREVLRHAGGQFVVLQSQAMPDVKFCRVAMRLAGASIEDLVPAHEQQDLDASSKPQFQNAKEDANGFP